MSETGESKRTEYPTSEELNIIRGKNIVGKATSEDVLRVFSYIDFLEFCLDDLEIKGATDGFPWMEYFCHPDTLKEPEP